MDISCTRKGDCFDVRILNGTIHSIANVVRFNLLSLGRLPMFPQLVPVYAYKGRSPRHKHLPETRIKFLETIAPPQFPTVAIKGAFSMDIGYSIRRQEARASHEANAKEIRTCIVFNLKKMWKWISNLYDRLYNRRREDSSQSKARSCLGFTTAYLHVDAHTFIFVWYCWPVKFLKSLNFKLLKCAPIMWREISNSLPYLLL